MYRIVVLLAISLGSASAQNLNLQIYPLSDIKKMKELPFLFISDNQFNNYLNDPNIIRNTVFDNVNPVAIRPPQLDLFSPDITSFALNK